MAPVTRSQLKEANASNLASTQKKPTPKAIADESRRKKQTAIRQSTKNPKQRAKVRRRAQKPKETGNSQTPIARHKYPERVLPPKALLHWNCSRCPDECFEGVFLYPIDQCIFCEHDLYAHEIRDRYAMDDPRYYQDNWNPYTPFAVKREQLVNGTLNLVRERGVVVIRATPQCGKTTLLQFLGRLILDEHPDLQPVFIHWTTRERRLENEKNYKDYLNVCTEQYTQYNSKHPVPRAPDAQKIYLVDEVFSIADKLNAQNAYPEISLWSQEIKGCRTRSKPLWVLVCCYGSTTPKLSLGDGNPNGSSVVHRLALSESLKIPLEQRIELFPSTSGSLCMKFTLQENEEVCHKWAIEKQFKIADGVCEYMQTVTGGHPGVMGLILESFDARFKTLDSDTRKSRTFTPQTCHSIVASPDGFVEEIERWGRGYFNYDGMRQAHEEARGFRINFADFLAVMRVMVKAPDGITRAQVESNFDAFRFCHQLGFLHTEPASDRHIKGKGKVTYKFASPIHRRIAYRTLFPGPEPEPFVDPDPRTVQEICVSAIKKMNPSALQSRDKNRWRVPEAVFQDELYRTLHQELQRLPIYSEYTHTGRGRVDFFVLDKNWGIEVLQCGTAKKILEHVNRFAPDGKYGLWKIMEDFAILNFCPKEKLQTIEISDEKLRSRTLQIAVDPSGHIADIYTADQRLINSLVLSEGSKDKGLKGTGLLLSEESGDEEIMDEGLTDEESSEEEPLDDARTEGVASDIETDIDTEDIKEMEDGEGSQAPASIYSEEMELDEVDVRRFLRGEGKEAWKEFLMRKPKTE